MTRLSQKTKITLLFPLASILLCALLILAVQDNFWNIAAHNPSQQALIPPANQQLSFYAVIISLLLLFFLAMHLMLLKLTKPLFEEVDGYRHLDRNVLNTTDIDESNCTNQACSANGKQSETLPQIAEQNSPASNEENINDLEIMENHLRYAQKMEAVGHMAGGIAHDFNNILTAIIGYGNILMMKLPAESPFVATAEQILAAAERGTSLTQRLLAFRRNQANNLSPVDLNAIIVRIKKLLHTLIGCKGTFISELAKQPLMVMADSIQMEQLLLSIATNLRDATLEGGSIITIRTELTDLDTDCSFSHGIVPKGRYALLSIFDTGPAMDDKTINVSDHCYDGIDKETGLNIAIVDGIVKKHRGHIICKSKPDRSKEFNIYLPIKQESETHSTPDPVAAPGKPDSYGIVLVGSDKASNTFTKGLLEEFGYSVIEADKSCMTSEQYHDHRSSIRLVIIDGIVTVANGLKILRAVKATFPVAQILICSDPQDSTIKQLNALNHDLHCISKPFSPKELLMNIREVVKDVA